MAVASPVMDELPDAALLAVVAGAAAVVTCVLICCVAACRRALIASASSRGLEARMQGVSAADAEYVFTDTQRALARLEALVIDAEHRLLGKLLLGDVLGALREQVDDLFLALREEQDAEARGAWSSPMRQQQEQSSDAFAANWFKLGLGRAQYEESFHGVVPRTGSADEIFPSDSASQAGDAPPTLNRVASVQARIANMSGELLEYIRSGFDDWDFDLSRMRSWCADVGIPPLIAITAAIHSGSGSRTLQRLLGTDERSLFAFMSRVVELYRGLPYHSEMHACDVMHAAMAMHRGLCGRGAPAHERATMIVAAVVHDLNHPGVNNAFMVETAAMLAVRYNDVSVLENYHVSLAFKVMMGLDRAGASNDPPNPLAQLDKAVFKRVRADTVSLVLATAFENHFSHIANLKARAKPHAPGGAAPDEKAREEERLMLLKMCMKAADIGHPAKQWAWHLDSARRACAEFFHQGECEARFGLPVSPLNNAAECKIAKAQTGFLEFMVKPAFDVLALYAEHCPAQLDDGAREWLKLPTERLEQNILRWKEMGDDESEDVKKQILAIEIAHPFDPNWFAELEMAEWAMASRRNTGSDVGSAHSAASNRSLPHSPSRRQSKSAAESPASRAGKRNFGGAMGRFARHSGVNGRRPPPVMPPLARRASSPIARSPSNSFNSRPPISFSRASRTDSIRESGPMPPDGTSDAHPLTATQQV